MRRIPERSRNRNRRNAKQAVLIRLEKEAATLYRRLTSHRPPSISVGFYPYAGLRHTVKKKEEALQVRISDILEKAPFPVLSAVSCLLLHKLFKLKAPGEVKRLYGSYVHRASIVEHTNRVRRLRGRKCFSGPAGKHFDLQTLFDELNETFFNNELEVEQLSWSSGSSRRTLGHFDPAYNAIVLSRALDREDVPQHVISFILYHEMLHVFLGETIRQGKRYKHHRRFRAAERDFPAYEEAVRFIEKEF
mgnify:CR=1 FL=1